MKPTSSGPAARTLAASLREEREARKIGLRALADKLGILPQLLSVWEKGQRLPSVEDVSAILALLGVTGEKRDRIRALARHAREPNWLASGNTDLPFALTTRLDLERTANAITSWSPLIVPGLLQTPDYIRAIVDSSAVPIEQADRQLRVRLARQGILTRREPIRFTALLGERSLQEDFGIPGVMSDQIDHLEAMAQRRNISLRIVPAGIGYHPGLIGPFEIYEFPGSPPIASVEHVCSTAFLHEDAQISGHQQVARLLAKAALSEEASLALLRDAAR
ncbi:MULTISPECIES: helix-turn-helix transcriptional regulator [unclassified Amycolatopsis]|uniref:helix-turn-helix domain-containing protein n=1 Tax=unclassified Amycolatopsis TaxID=2618356 RepID=UPI002874E219|nr:MULTISPECIES: helix-turn-helix transcriptional regulator [unclassified Amycolatopsis]MDS0139803.1 helix-turn-helix transcriptional regulator [Amycolatopsis sp. 505]MDS0145226.1 helix-turn-helix transcriptional regulator [Amycolatopsis sp. CM201R]